MTGAAPSYAALFASWLALGAGEAASYPAGGRVIRLWAPEAERGSASSLLNSGSYAGLAVGAPLVGWIVTAYGWRASFYITGAIGVVLSFVCYALYRAPVTPAWLDGHERSLILAERSGKPVRGADAPASVWALLRSPTMWASPSARAAPSTPPTFSRAGSPPNLGDVRHLDVLRSSLFTAVPYAVAVPLSIVPGIASDRLLRRTGTAGGGRRPVGRRGDPADALRRAHGPAAAGVQHRTARVTTALNMLIALTGDLLVDERLAGSAIGVLVLGGNGFGVAAPTATGYIVSSRLGYVGAFAVASALLLVAVVTV